MHKTARLFAEGAIVSQEVKVPSNQQHIQRQRSAPDFASFILSKVSKKDGGSKEDASGNGEDAEKGKEHAMNRSLCRLKFSVPSFKSSSA